MDVTNKKKVIVITGFGPFKNHPVNASWEAVKVLLKMCGNLESFYEVKIVGLEIPVAYKDVSDIVPNLWKEHEPMFVIHVGVSSEVKFLTLESTAHGHGYVKPDIYKKLPDEQELQNAVFHPELDIKNLSQTINDKIEESHCKAVVSHNAGRYLCEFIFYKSLHIDASRTLFVHVPDMDIYSSEQTAHGLYFIIKHLLTSLNC